MIWNFVGTLESVGSGTLSSHRADLDHLIFRKDNGKTKRFSKPSVLGRVHAALIPGARYRVYWYGWPVGTICALRDEHTLHSDIINLTLREVFQWPFIILISPLLLLFNWRILIRHIIALLLSPVIFFTHALQRIGLVIGRGKRP